MNLKELCKLYSLKMQIDKDKNRINSIYIKLSRKEPLELEELIFLRRFLNYLLDKKFIDKQHHVDLFEETRLLKDTISQETKKLITDRIDDSVVGKYRYDYEFENYHTHPQKLRSEALKKYAAIKKQEIDR